MTQTIKILSMWVDGLNWVVETEPGSYLYIQRGDLQPNQQNPVTENGLGNDGVIYFLASYLDRMQSNAIGNTIVIDPSTDVMVRVEPTTG
jgi:hypothetical protein